MQQTHVHKSSAFLTQARQFPLWILIVVILFGLSVVQDYIYSQTQHTGFYISESLLYNSIWFFLAPLTFLHAKLTRPLVFNSPLKKFGVLVLLSLPFTFIHIVIFSSFFVLVSYFVFSPTHYFSAIFNSALSNQLYILTFFYTFIYYLIRATQTKNKKVQTRSADTVKIHVKIGLKTIYLETAAIEHIITQKPYTLITAEGKEYLDNRTLKDFEALLNAKNFVRVHRSAIINKHFVTELKSRKNGDYDAFFESGQVIRFSRHYRDNWIHLFQ